MASITSLTGSSSTSSIYGNSNIISGLASGMDTESMIENAVSGIKNKIAGLNQDREMLEWEQNAYRSIIDKLSTFSDKYLSYISSTNLLSASFFDSATNVTTSGKYSNLVSATGNPSSTVKVLGVKQLATAATYFAGIGGTGKGFTSKALDLGANVQTSNVSGKVKFTYNDQTVEVSFEDSEVFTTKEDFLNAFNTKLQTALEEAGLDKEAVKVAATENGFNFEVKDADANGFKISSVGSKIAATTGISTGELKDDGYTLTAEQLYTEETVLESMIGEDFSFTLDGETKTVSLSETDQERINNSGDALAELATVLQEKVNDAFGANKIKIEPTSIDSTAGTRGITFNTVNNGSTLKIAGAEELGLSSSATSYVSTSQKLSELVGAGYQNANGGYSFTINGKTLELEGDATIGQLMTKINEDEEIGVKVSFSQFTNSFQFTAKETGSAGKVQFGVVDENGNKDLAAALFGVANDTGDDAILSLEVNGMTMTDVTRSSNQVTVDGMTIKLNGTFTASAADAVSFNAAADSDKIVKAVKSMIEDFNTMANEIKDAYSTQPLRNSKGKRYEPLTAEDAEDMSESAIEKYEKKAKTGILFGDRDLSNLYNELRSALGDMDLASIGITTEFDSGKTTLKLDETKLRNVLESDPDKVRDTLTKSKTSGSSNDGMLAQFKTTIEKYAKTTGTKGILVKLAGSEKSAVSLHNNDYKSRMDRLQEQIERWEEKLSTKIDYYTRQFSALEKLISEMNAQSSALSGMMGY